MKRVAAAVVVALVVGFTPAMASDLTLEETLCLRRVVDYLEARDIGLPDAEEEFFAEDSRVWFESRDGEGRLRRSGRGPWADWDEFFNAETMYLSFSVDRRRTSVVMLESNDFYELIERAPGKIRVTYDFDEAGFVTGTLVEGLPSEEPGTDRLDEFKAWAAEKYPDALALLMPDGDIAPELERAKIWKKLLIEWRTDVGLPVD